MIRWSCVELHRPGKPPEEFYFLRPSEAEAQARRLEFMYPRARVVRLVRVVRGRN